MNAKLKDTKTKLLECAEDLIQRLGVNAMSYNDLSQAVGITKASIHHHFPKKEDLIETLLVRCKTTYNEHYRSIAASNNHSSNKLKDIAGLFEDSLRHGKVCLIGMLSSEYGSLGTNIQKALDSSIQETTAIFEKIFIQAQKEGIISENIDPHKAGYGFLSFLLGAQILSRCIGNIDIFSGTTQEYIKMLK